MNVQRLIDRLREMDPDDEVVVDITAFNGEAEAGFERVLIPVNEICCILGGRTVIE